MKRASKQILTALLAVAALSLCATARAAEKTTFEEAFGGATGFALYNTQMVLGLTADAYANSVYNNQDVQDIVNEQKSLLSVLDDYVNGLLVLDTVSTSDRESLVDIGGCIKKLNATADSLSSYSANSTQENADDFQTKRQASYDAIADLLGIKK